MKKLGDIFEIKTGYTFRGSIAELEPGTVAVVQAGDINGARLAQTPRVVFEGDKHLLQAGDIVLSVRGSTTARTVLPDLLPAVAASSVLVLRPTSPGVNSKFIAQYLNSKKGQAAIAKVVSGAYIKTLRKVELEALEVPLPASETQAAVVELGSVIERYKQVLRNKEDLLTNIYDEAIKLGGASK